jgi:hypothetical protein
MFLLRDRLVSEERTEVTYEKTMEAIKTYGDQLKGIIGSSSSDPPGAGLAVAEKGLQDKIAVVGTSIGSMAGPGLEDGSIKVVSSEPTEPRLLRGVGDEQVLEGRPSLRNGFRTGRTISWEGHLRGQSGILNITKENYRIFTFRSVGSHTS